MQNTLTHGNPNPNPNHILYSHGLKVYTRPFTLPKGGVWEHDYPLQSFQFEPDWPALYSAERTRIPQEHSAYACSSRPFLDFFVGGSGYETNLSHDCCATLCNMSHGSDMI